MVRSIRPRQMRWKEACRRDIPSTREWSDFLITNRTAVYDKNAELYKHEESPFHKIANPAIYNILKKYNAKTVLDLTCGTGNQVFWLAKRGYKVVGADLSANSIRVARQLAKERKVRIRFLHGDMRNIKVGKFDAVITMFNAVGHLTKPGFERAMRNICGNLNDRGVYIFDIINTKSAGLNHDVDKTTELNGVMVHNIQLCRIDVKTGIMSVDEAFCRWKNHSDLEVGKRVRWTMQTYTAKWLREMLSKNGFEVVGQYALSGSRFSDTRSKSILTVAQKI